MTNINATLIANHVANPRVHSAVGQAVKNLPPRIVSESLPNLLGLGNIILL